MKKQIIEKLSTKFVGVSESILDRIAAKLAKTITEESQIEAAVEAVTFQSVLESYGDSRATEATQTAVKNYETKYGLKDGKAAHKEGEGEGEDPAKNTPEGGEQIPQWAKQMMEDNKALRSQLDSMNAEKLNAGRRSKVDAIVSKLPESLRAPYARIDVSSLSDEDFEAQLQSITTEVDGIASSIRTKGAVFSQPTFGAAKTINKSEEVNPAVLAEIEAQSKRDENAQNF